MDELNKKQAKAALEATLEAITGSLKKGEELHLVLIQDHMKRKLIKKLEI